MSKGNDEASQNTMLIEPQASQNTQQVKTYASQKQRRMWLGTWDDSKWKNVTKQV